MNIFPEHLKFLSFSWDSDARAQTRHFHFTIFKGMFHFHQIVEALKVLLEVPRYSDRDFFLFCFVLLFFFFFDGVDAGESFPVL